nr:PAS domain-containing protein [Pirellulales bacterium]
GPAVRTPPWLSAAQLSERTLLERYTPAAVTIDRDGRIIHFHGDTTPFLAQPTGEPTRDLMQMARDHVRGSIRIALQEAVAENRVAHHRNGFLDTDEGRFRIHISVEPLDAKPTASLYLVTFGKVREAATPLAVGDPGTREVADLHDELSRTRDELQSTIEELQSTNEEMRASTEETMSINEELQSTNEELETSKEEMQSLNEELTTVNVQLQLKSDEHEATSNDLTSLLSSTRVAVLFLDPKFRIRRYTPAVRDLIELIAADVGRPMADLHTKFDDPSLLADCQAVLDKLSPVEREVPSASGQTYMRRVQPYRTVDNRIDGVVITFINITEIKQTEDRRRELEQRFRMVVEGARDFALLLLDPQGRIITWNAGAELMLGYSAAEAEGAQLAMIFAGKDADAQAARKLKRAARDGRVAGEGWRQRKDRSRVWARDVLTAVRDAAGELTGYVQVVSDDSARRDAEMQRDELLVSEQVARRTAENANIMMDQFVARLSHELRTPLSAILTWAQLMQEDRLDEQDRREGLRVIERSATAQAELLNDLLDVSRIASGKLRLERVGIELTELVREAVEAIKPLASQRGIQLSADLNGDPCPMLADPERLRQVVSNLLTNAAKFTPSGGNVNVRLQCDVDAVEIEVSDTGQGIDSEFLPHIFTPFSQADHTMTRSYGGLGLGLSICKELAELHGGSIRAHSEGPGRGATFVVRLPRALHEEVDHAGGDGDSTAAPGADALRGMHILFVEDETATATAMGRMLERFGARVTSVDSADAAFDAFATATPDVIVSDVGLPKEDGYQLLKRIRSLEAERLMAPTPAIALTAFAGSQHRGRALAAGFQMHITKPAKLGELIRAIVRLAPKVREA